MIYFICGLKYENVLFCMGSTKNIHLNQIKIKN